VVVLHSGASGAAEDSGREGSSILRAHTTVSHGTGSAPGA